jgi:hypothetical protein
MLVISTSVIITRGVTYNCEVSTKHEDNIFFTPKTAVRNSIRLSEVLLIDFPEGIIASGNEGACVSDGRAGRLRFRGHHSGS